MELRCALVLTLAGVVVASPHGVGVKGGALAKAEAGAVSGAFSGFGGAPVIPAGGAAYSGSFSKASSSSFAASSASSSSFSFSGAGGLTSGNAYPSLGGNGCGSDGNCANNVHGHGSGPQTSVSNSQGNGQAQSGAVAAAGAVAGGAQFNDNGSPCNGDCLTSPNCKGPKCENNPNKCSSGQCGSHPQPESSTHHDVNDIPVNIHGVSGSKNSFDSNPQRPVCTSGSCGQSNLKDVGNNDYNPRGDSSYNVKTPGHKTSCPSGNCATADLSKPESFDDGSYKPYDDSTYNKASEYNAPGPACATGNCGRPATYNPETFDDGSYKPFDDTTYNQAPEYGSSRPSCTSGSCQPSVQTNTKPFDDGSYKPTYTQSMPEDHSSKNAHPQYQSSQCNSPNCNGAQYKPQSTSGSSNLNTNPVGKPSSVLTTPVHENKCTSPNCNNFASSPNSALPPSSYNVPIHGSYTGIPVQDNVLKCSSGNCNYGGSQSSSNSNSISTNYLNPGPKPTVHSSCSSPNCDSKSEPTPSPSVVDYPNFVPLKQNCVSGLCSNGVTGTGVANSGVTNTIYPNGGITAYPALKEGPLNVPHCGTPGCAVQTYPTYNPSSGPVASNCVSGNCGSSPLSQPSFTVPSLQDSPKPASQKPVYTGNFGGPPGLLNPNDYSIHVKPVSSPAQPTVNPVNQTPGHVHDHSHVPSTVPSVNLIPNHPSGGNVGSSGQPGNINPHYHQTGSAHQVAAGAIAGAHAVAYTGGFGGPPGLLKPYDGGKLGVGGSSNIGHKHLGSPQNIFTAPNAGTPSFGTSLTGASAGAAAVAGAVSGENGNQGGYSVNSPGNIGGGCNSGCGSNGGKSFDAASNLEHGGFGALSGSGASAKSLSGAVSGAGGGAGSYGVAGSFASSSASSGAATKGGYGK